MGKSYSLFIKGKKHGRMMLVSIDNGPLVYPTIEENRQTRPKKYSKLTEAQQLQDDCNVQATNIILHGLATRFYAYLSQHERHANEVRISREIDTDDLCFCSQLSNSDPIHLKSPQHSGYSMYPPPQQFTPVYAAPIHHQHHHTPVNPQQHLISPPPFISPSMAQQSQAEFPQLDSGNRGIPTTSKGNVAAGPPRVVKCYNYQGEEHMARQLITEDLVNILEDIKRGPYSKKPQYATQKNATWFKEKLMLAEAQEAGQILDEEQFAFLADTNYDGLSSAKAVLMVDLSSFDHEVLFEYSEQTHVDDFEDNEIHSGSNIIPYSKYLQELQDAVIYDTNPFAPNDLLVLSLVEQMTDHVAHLDKENQTK
ncbi:hypothetical protein Tco_0818642 [Tanacetum coccineum]